MKKLTQTLLGDSLALISGAILTLTFAPFDIFPLAILSPALFLSVLLNISAKRAFWRGWLYGAGLFSTGVYWIFISVHTYGNTSTLIALIITGALISILALFPALNGYWLNRFFPKTNDAKILYAFPAIWVLLEWVRSWVFSGFPWLLIGYSQIETPLRGYASVFSIYGVSLAVLLSSALLVNIFIQYKNKNIKNLSINLFVFALIWVVGGYLSHVSWTQPAGAPVKISLVQGNIPQELKWSPDQVQPTLDRYLELTEPHWDSAIIIWPESAVPLPLQNAADFIEKLAQTATDHQATLITGIPIKAPDREGYYNAVIAIGNGEGLYTKHQLVPFGEYIPFRKIFGRVMDLLNVPMSDFISGNKSPKPIIANGTHIAAFICYEIAYPEQVLSRDSNIEMLLTVSNDAWFGRSIAQAQHAEMARMRAIEMGRPVLFASNDGITAVINARGRIQSIAPQHEAYVLTDLVQPTRGKTPWQQFAMDPIMAILIMLLFFAVRRRHW